MLVAKRSLSRSPLCGLWRFHHKGMTVINSPAIGSPSPRWRPRQLGGAESQPSDHAWSFWGAAPPCPHPGPQTPVATSAYKSSYWSLGDSRVSGATSWAPGQRQTPCGLGPTLGLTLFFIPVLTNHDACVRTEAGADTGWQCQRGCGRGDSRGPLHVPWARHCSEKRPANSEEETRHLLW